MTAEEILKKFNELDKEDRLEFWRQWLSQIIYLPKEANPRKTGVGFHVRIDEKFTDIVLEAICAGEDPEDYLLEIYGDDFIIEYYGEKLDEYARDYFDESKLEKNKPY